MIAYEVKVNGKKVATVGLRGCGDVLLIAECFSHSKGKKWMAAVNATGLRPGRHREGEFLTWFKKQLRLGDEVSFRLIETERVDKPRKIERRVR